MISMLPVVIIVVTIVRLSANRAPRPGTMVPAGDHRVAAVSGGDPGSSSAVPVCPQPGRDGRRCRHGGLSLGCLRHQCPPLRLGEPQPRLRPEPGSLGPVRWVDALDGCCGHRQSRDHDVRCAFG
jgi:hypothetical protein